MSAVLGHALTARGYSIATASCKGKYISVMPIKLFAGETHSVLSRTNGWKNIPGGGVRPWVANGADFGRSLARKRAAR